MIFYSLYLAGFDTAPEDAILIGYLRKICCGLLLGFVCLFVFK